MWAFSLFSKRHIGHVNHGNLKIYRGVGVSATFLAVMRCSYQFFAVLRYSEPPQCPPLGDNINRFAGSEGKRDVFFFSAFRASLTRPRRVARSLRSQKKLPLAPRVTLLLGRK